MRVSVSPSARAGPRCQSLMSCERSFSAVDTLGTANSVNGKETEAMTFVGCDLHTRQQQVAVLDTTTGEIHEQQLPHEGTTVEDFYAALPRPVTVGIESTGYAIWFHTLLQRLGHTVLVGDAAKIRAMVVRKTKTDRRAARHILDLLRHDRFPTIWLPDPATRELRALLMHRLRLVRIQTMLKNGVQALALNQGLVRGSKLLRRAGLALLGTLRTHLAHLDEAIAAAALAHPEAPRLLTHPGVGPLTALATVVVLGTVSRFPDSKHVVSYVGLAPTLNASADKYRLGKITKQGSTLLRFVLGQAAAHAARLDPDLIRTYRTLAPRRGRSKARVAVARKLLVRLFIMLRDHIDYDEFRRRGRAPAAAPGSGGCALTPASHRHSFQCGRARSDSWSAMTAH